MKKQKEEKTEIKSTSIKYNIESLNLNLNNLEKKVIEIKNLLSPVLIEFEFPKIINEENTDNIKSSQISEELKKFNVKLDIINQNIDLIINNFDI